MIIPLAIYFEQCDSHWHVAEAQTTNDILLLMTGGNMTYIVNQERILAQKGDMIYVPSGSIRAACKEVRQAHSMFVAHFVYEGSGEGLPLLTDPILRKTGLLQFDYIKQRFSLLTQYWLRKPIYATTLCHSILLEIMALFNTETDAKLFPDKSLGMVMQIQDFIANHYRRGISMTELSELVGRTPNYVSTLFKQATGQTITDYIHLIRITAACDLLVNSQMNIQDISDFLGFCDQSYFYKVFKKVTGTLPSAYVKANLRLWR